MKFQVFVSILTVTILFTAIHETEALTEACNSTSCGTNAECRTYQCELGVQCVCNAGYEYYGLKCVPATKKVGETCSSTATCMGVNTNCFYYNSTYEYCRCTNSFTANSDNTDCIATKLGADCTTTGCGTYAECVNDVCTCMPGYKTSGDGTNCTHLLPGDACKSTTECQKENCHGGTCTTGYYECLNGLKWYISSYTKTASSDIVLKHGSCVPARSITDIGSDGYCGTSESEKYFYCSSGYVCEVCPEDIVNTERRRCLGSGASIPSFSYLAVVCALLLSTYFH